MTPQYNINWLKHSINETGNKHKFLYFWGHTPTYKQSIGEFCLSQWYESPFTVNQVTYNTTEHWMMAHKALIFRNFDIYQQIIVAKTPGEAKALGREVRNFDRTTWAKYRSEVVITGNIHKFNQHPALLSYLLNTKPRILVEASPVDVIWGIGLAKDNAIATDVNEWRGLNLLGWAIMEARDFLQTNGTFKEVALDIPSPWHKFITLAAANNSYWQSKEGKIYLIRFKKKYVQLTEYEKVIYQLYNPDFYNLGLYKTH